VIAIAVYVLCAATAFACAALLARSYIVHMRTRLQFWSAVSFAGLTIANILLVIDLVLVPNVDLNVYRSVITLTSGAVLLYSLISETTS
jgi:hypothetical protein